MGSSGFILITTVFVEYQCLSRWPTN